MIVNVKTAAVNKVGILHTKSGSPLIHLGNEGIFRTGNEFCHGNAGVIGTGNTDTLYQGINGLGFTRL